MDKKLVAIHESTIERYSDRYRKLGDHVRTLGWGSIEQQQYRFDQVLKAVAVIDKSVLDIGCGFGDFIIHCEKVGCRPTSYTGWDINPDLIEEAANKNPGHSFSVFNLADKEIVKPVAQIGVMLGVLNFNFKQTYNNISFSKLMIKKAFDSVSETLIVDFLSIYRDEVYPKEDFVFYHDPCDMLAIALDITPNVKLYHDYDAIPQKEFMLVLEHK